MIPALIYQTWKSKTSLPENFAHWRASFARLNPGYTLLLWDDADNRQFIADHFAWFLPTYDGFPQEIFRVDAVRYFFLYLHGGIYVDLDTQCLKPLDPLRSQADVVLGWLGNDPTSDQAIPNAIMLSRPRQEFWLLAIAIMLDQVGRHTRPEYVTGPTVLKAAVEQYGQAYASERVQQALTLVRTHMGPALQPTEGRSKVAVLPGYALYPLDWGDQIHDQLLRKPMLQKQQVLSDEMAQQLFPKSYMVTYWACSWGDDLSQTHQHTG